MLFLRTRGPEIAPPLPVDAGRRRGATAGRSSALGADGPIPEAEKIRRERTRERSSGIVAFSTDTALTRSRSPGQRQALAPRPREQGALRALDTLGAVVDPRLDPTGHRVAYVTDGSLHVLELADGNDRELAAADGPDVFWGLAEHVASESMHRTRGHWWSPDGTRLLAAR